MRAAWVVALSAALSACGGGSTPAPEALEDPGVRVTAAVPTSRSVQATSMLDAHRLAQQASFGPTEASLREIIELGPREWLIRQMTLPPEALSRYASGGSDDVHQYTGSGDYCSGRASDCWGESFSATPLLRDFYRNAVEKPDQLRQRVALALEQILVVSDREVSGTYGHRQYHNALLNQAFGNWRDLLRTTALSPLMGDFLNNANNDKQAPNENYARELMQLFSVGLCELNSGGSLKGDRCVPTYDNETVREMAFALTGWTFPPGGATPWGCPTGLNCRYYRGELQAAPAFHDSAARTLLGGRPLAAGSTPQAALEAVLDSIMAHPNVAPFVAKRLISHLVGSNPSRDYVARVSAAFETGHYDGFGTGRKGDLAATVAALLLDDEARRLKPARGDGKLREPALLFAGVLRALNGHTDGRALSWWLGESSGQRMFAAPSVFSFYAPDYAVPGSDLMGPSFEIHTAATAVSRLQFINCAIMWNGCGQATRVDLAPLVATYAADGAPERRLPEHGPYPADEKLVDRLSRLAYGQPLPAEERAAIVEAMQVPWTTREARVKQAAFLVFAAPDYQVAP